ncbi:NUDIX domain-containing protein [Candidatus Woesearchaeota archaeon]|nr:NUDIX domain-containing protein [Candidatus Woesearchaeota archaeon]
MKTYFVVTGILMNKGKVLILKKSPKDHLYPNKWSFCSGYVKEFEPAEGSVLREIKEETGLNAVIAKKGRLFQVSDKSKGRCWVIMPFLCKSKSRNVRLDHENAEFKWIKYSDIKRYPTVPGLEKDLKVLGLK